MMDDASPWRTDAGAVPEAPTWDEAGPVAEQRTTPRFTLLIRTAKLIAPSGEYLCIVRDVSSDGVKVRTFHPLPAEDDFSLELASGERQPVRKVWEEGDLAGFQFRDAVPLDRLLAEAPEGLRKRSVRLRLALPAVLFAGTRQLDGTFIDISQHGACIECDGYLAVDERVRVAGDVLPELVGRVRWRRRPYYGLIFEQTFRFDELARLTAPLQAGGPMRALGHRRVG